MKCGNEKAVSSFTNRWQRRLLVDSLYAMHDYQNESNDEIFNLNNSRNKTNQ